MEQQLIGAFGEFCFWQDLLVCPPVCICDEGAQARPRIAFNAEEVDFQARRRAAPRCVQHMCRQISAHDLPQICACHQNAHRIAVLKGGNI